MGTELAKVIQLGSEDLDSNPGSLASRLLNYTPLSGKISNNFKPLSSAQEGRNLENIPGFVHYTTLFSLRHGCMFICPCAGPASVQGIKRTPGISVVGYRGESVKGKPKSWTTYMQDSSLKTIGNMSLYVNSSYFNVICPLLLRKEDHNSSCT